MAQAAVTLNHRSLSYLVLKETLELTTDFGDIEGLCECQLEKFGYYGGGDRGNHLKDLKARFGSLPA